MGVSADPPLDEIQWRSPESIQEMGSIHTNTVLHYFSRSPFFDTTSNNATLTTQALYNQNLSYILGTRVLFEDRLRSMQGLEYLVTHDPSEGDTKQEHNGIWVITKQNRKKRQGAPDELIKLAAYFVVGEHIYQAPSIGIILESRLLATVTSLTNMLRLAASLPTFTPTSGYRYEKLTANTGITVSVDDSTKHAESESAEHDSTPYENSLHSVTKPSSDQRRIMLESWDASLRYGTDYMDENPIIGEPGSFKLSKAREVALPSVVSTAAGTVPLKLSTDSQGDPTTNSSAAPTKSDETDNRDADKKSGGGKIKKTRRKSRAGTATATP